MSRPSLLMVHGWAFDRSFWDPLRRALGDLECIAWDRGYFGESFQPCVTAPAIVVGHSLGSLLAMRDLHSHPIALVAINGFDRFTDAPGQPGVPRRLLDRMIDRFAQTPAGVVADFRARCGVTAPFARLAPDRLGADLKLLRDGDVRSRTAEVNLPILSLHGEEDPILPAAVRAHAFGTGRTVRHISHPTGGHLLPVSDPDWCARQIGALIGRLS